jgi:energy-coupling factor transporter ATP-binding protein EcfA2
MKIKTLQIKSFRGATKLLTVEFDPSKSITMIFGENGNGKTTIADALVCLCKNEHGSLDDKTSVDKKYLRSVGSPLEDVFIELDTDSGKYSARLKSSTVFTKSPADGIPPLRFLRRKQIIDLLEEQPSKRYEKLQEYIDVTGIMASEDALRKLIKTTKTEQASETKSLADSTNTLERIWDNERRPKGSWEEWAKEESEKDISKEQQKHNQLSDAFQKWLQVSTKFKAVEQQKANHEILQKQVTDLEAKLLDIEKQGKAGNGKLLSVLEAAQAFVDSEHKMNSCPICKNKVVKEDLIVSLRSEINSMKSLQSVTRDFENARQTKGKTLAVIDSGQSELTELLKKFCSAALQIFVTKGSPEELMVTDLNNHARIENAFVHFQSHINALGEVMKTIEAKASQIFGAIKQVNAIRENYNTILRVRSNAQHLQQVLDVAEKTLKIVESERKKFIEDSLNAVSADIETMYRKMHPGEELGDIRLFLNPDRKNSLEIGGSFHSEKEISPQSLYSESHLDTLSICILIALAKRYNEGNTILLLDDIILSVDDRHLDRFIELLHEEADHFSQILITTHYRPWRDRYRTHRGPSGKVHFIELRPWTKEGGITLQNGRVQIQELELSLNDKSYFDRQAIASKSGILLENLLDYLTDIYEYHLPKRKNQKYTLGEMIDTLQAKYLKNIKAVHISTSKTETEHYLLPVVEDLKKLLFIRNQVGAHFNLDDHASDDDVRLFGRKTLDLGEILVCKQTGQLPLTKSGDHWKSKQGTIKLFPVEKD